MKAMILTLITVACMAGICMIGALCPGGNCGTKAPTVPQREAELARKAAARTLQPAKPAAKARK